MTTNTTIHNNHHVIYKPWHTCRPYDNITFIIIAYIFFLSDPHLIKRWEPKVHWHTIEFSNNTITPPHTIIN
ncbi:Uncharacterised protein [Corynebacterium diphtheriae]|nr:Uncharacterised protein [Corynebacterium diphtheriae]